MAANGGIIGPVNTVANAYVDKVTSITATGCFTKASCNACAPGKATVIVVAGGGGSGGGFVGICYFVRSSIYFEESLGLGLNMFSEKWTDKLFKGIGLSRKQDIQVGDDQIDSRFIIQGTDEKEIISLLSDQNIRKNINLLDEKRLKKGAIKGSFKIFDNRVTYSEGPYDHVVGFADIADPEGVMEAMLNLVKSVEDCYD